MPRHIRNYEILRELGSGQYGTVYVAVGEVPGRGISSGKRRLVAIKKLKETNEHNRDALLQEFALLDEVKHRGIVRVFEYLQDDDAVVMEYVHGITLRQVLDECARAREQVFTEAAVEMICELADALYQAFTTPSDNGESLNLVHRDLKPENIMLTRSGEVKILDFGLARVDNDEYAREAGDRIKGTPIYMAPEQASGDGVDHRTDLFSLGLIAYELFMNKAAYRLAEDSHDPLGDIFDDIERGALQDQCQELEAKLPGVGPIIAKLLQANPDGRYRNGQDLLVDLRQQLYRDRGSYLAEFAEFFYGSIYDLADPPTLDGAVGRAPYSSGNQRRRRMSMEERLRASMAREAEARKQSEKPSTGRKEPDKRGAPEPEASPWEPAGARKPRVREVGSRSPDETGMLEMVPLREDSEEADVEADPSATAFFAIPAPKDSRPTASPPAAPPPGPIAQGPGAPIAQGPVAQAPGGIRGPVAGQPGKGPVASYESGKAATPFQVGGGPGEPPPADAGARTQSNRVFAILLAMMLLVGVSVFAAVWLRPWENTDPAEVADNAAADADVAKGTNGSSKASDGAAAVDSDEPLEEQPERKPTSNTTNRNPGSGSSSSGGGGSSVPKVPGGTLIVKISGIDATQVQVSCPSGSQRANVVGNTATLTNVGTGCKMTIKSYGPPVNVQGVSGGKSISCSVTGSTAICR
ncbi:MAG TPA: serine/threonine-protein kinase [Myxococcota bacterium]|nr:serine/threonine-protein kinase [Myxococcota bacterium]